MLWFPVILAGGASWLVISGRRNALEAKEKMETNYQRMMPLVTDAFKKNLLTTDVNAKVVTLQKLRDEVNDLSATWSAEEVYMKAMQAARQADEISGQVAKALGIASPTTNPDKWTWQDYATVAAVGLGVYFGYRILFGDKPLLGGLFGGHGETIPRSQLPRYAGGSRQ